MALEVGLQTSGVRTPESAIPVMSRLYHTGGANRTDACVALPAAGTVGRLTQLLAGTDVVGTVKVPVTGFTLLPVPISTTGYLLYCPPDQ